MTSSVESLIQEFVVRLRAAIAEEAAQAFIIAGGGVPKGRPGAKPGARSASTAVSKKRSAKSANGGKRTAEEIDAQADTILAYLKKHPASGAEALGAGLGMTTAELALPIKKLLARKSLKTAGQRRGTTYTAK